MVWLKAIARARSTGARDGARPREGGADAHSRVEIRPEPDYTAEHRYSFGAVGLCFGRPGGHPVFLVLALVAWWAASKLPVVVGKAPRG